MPEAYGDTVYTHIALAGPQPVGCLCRRFAS
jgi:hypothetical protein